MALGIDDEVLDHAHARCPPGNAIMGADGNHPALVRGFLIERVELGFKLSREVAAGAPPILEVLKIIELEGVGHYDKGLALHGDHKRFVAAQIVGVIQKSQILQDAESLRRGSHAGRVKADGTSPSSALNSLN